MKPFEGTLTIKGYACRLHEKPGGGYWGEVLGLPAFGHVSAEGKDFREVVANLTAGITEYFTPEPAVEDENELLTRTRMAAREKKRRADFEHDKALGPARRVERALAMGQLAREMRRSYLATKRPTSLRFVVFTEPKGPRLWAQEEGDTGAIFAEADTMPELRKLVRAELERGRRVGWLLDWGFVRVPKVTFREATPADRRAISRQDAELERIMRTGKFVRVTFSRNGEIATVNGRRVPKPPTSGQRP
jgi:predicted RNase H-like HicB family nuclease